MPSDLPGSQMESNKTTPFPHWYTPANNVLNITDGEEARVYDEQDSEYLDFLSQLYCVNAGHDNTAIIEAMEEQLQQIPYVSSAKHNDTRTQLANRLGEIASGSLSDVFFAISGSEANESAIQFARAYQDASKVLTRWRSYHGGTYGAASLTGDPSTRTAVESYATTTGTAKFLPPLPHRSPFDADTPDELAEQAANHLEFVIRNEGPDSIAALLIEPVGGTSGAYPAPPGYFDRVRELCDKYDILLIADEVITGFGRCSEWFGVQTEDIEPDMITFAKGVTSAYAPLAGVITSSEIGNQLKDEGIGVGQTFGGHPIGCAAGVAAIAEYQDGLIENVRELAPVLEDRLSTLESKHEAVGSVHGRGFLWSVEFTDPETGEPYLDPWVDDDDENPVAEVRAHAREHGVLFGSGRPDVQTIIAPPFCINETDITTAIDTLDDAIETVFN